MSNSSSELNLKALKALIEIGQHWSMTNNGSYGGSTSLIEIVQHLSMTGIGTYGGSTSSLISEVREASSESNKSDTQHLEDELLNIHIQNYREKLSAYKPTLSAVIDQPDFQPVSFLESGLDKSYAVCRISRYYSREALQQTFQNLKEMYKEFKNNNIDLDNLDFFNSVEELKCMFLIPNSLFSKVFNEQLQVNPKITFLKSIECLDAHIDELLKLNPLPLGTGFLVGNSHLLTNHHVMPTPEIARECVAQFGYEDAPTKIFKTLNYKFDSNLLFVTNAELDYTLVQLQSDTFTKRPAGYNFGWLDLIESEDDIAPSLDKNQVNTLIEKLNNYDYSEKQLIFMD